MNTSESAIGIFDSGIGGLTVAKEISNRLPNESLIYFGDSARCPYGPRSLEEVKSFVLQIGRWLTKRDVKLIVIACNSGTAAGLKAAQEVFDIPIIGVIEPGARAAVQVTRNRRVGIIGTAATIGSGAYEHELLRLDAGIKVFQKATPEFVDIVENDLFGDSTCDNRISHETVRSLLEPIRNEGIDSLVLGCTHFPIIKPLISAVMGEGVEIISSAEEAAFDVASTLFRRHQMAPANSPSKFTFATTTEDLESFKLAATAIFSMPIEEVEYVSLNDLESL